MGIRLIQTLMNQRDKQGVEFPIRLSQTASGVSINKIRDEFFSTGRFAQSLSSLPALAAHKAHGRRGAIQSAVLGLGAIAGIAITSMMTASADEGFAIRGATLERVADNPNREEQDTNRMTVMDLLTDPSATIISERRIGRGANGALEVMLSNGLKAVWKPKKSEYVETTLVPSIPKRTFGRREAAAYCIARRLGIKAPAAVYRTLDGEDGALIEFVDGVETYDGRDPAFEPGVYEDLSAFDAVIGNCGRHVGNVLYRIIKDEWGNVVRKKTIPIDHGLSFPEENKRVEGHFMFSAITPKRNKLSPEMHSKLLNLLADQDEVAHEIVPLIGQKATRAMWERVGHMLATWDTTSLLDPYSVWNPPGSFKIEAT